jgi:hypothetical protein
MGSGSVGAHSRRESRRGGFAAEERGSAVNYPENLCFLPRLAFKMKDTSQEMEQKRQILTAHAVVITEEGHVGVRSRDEVKDIIWHHFGICKNEFYIYRSYPEPFVAYFHEAEARDVVFVAARVVEDPIELEFHAWDIDIFGDRGLIPYHVKFSLEGIPQHAWSKEIADLILGDEAIIKHVEVDAERQLDQCIFQCWVICKDPSKVSQMVFLSLAKYESGPRRSAQVHFARPRQALDSHVFKIMIHIDAIEDLMFYHYPREELMADGKIPWRDFKWQLGRMDGDVNEEEL